MKTYTKEECKNDYNQDYSWNQRICKNQRWRIWERGDLNDIGELNQTCTCTYYRSTFTTLAITGPLYAYEQCKHCLGYGRPPIPWSELKR